VRGGGTEGVAPAPLQDPPAEVPTNPQPEAPSGLGCAEHATNVHGMENGSRCIQHYTRRHHEGQRTGVQTIVQCDDKGRKTRKRGSSDCGRSHEGEMNLFDDMYDDTRTQERRSQEPMITKRFRCRGN